MPATAENLESVQSVENVIFEDQHPAAGDSCEELLAGLNQSQKQINPKFFYDARGSELFEKITQLQEYYPTRSERSILAKNATEIAQYCGDDCVLIEPGSGSSEKVRLLLEAIRPAVYMPLDISAEFLCESAIKLGREFPWLPIHAICADFSDQWQKRTELPAGRRVVFYPGSTIGNLEPQRAHQFLSGLCHLVGNDGGVLIGVDLHKSKQSLTAAYNDEQGVTAEFNLNILNSVNKFADAEFRQEDFFHQAFYNEDLRRIEMHLVSKESQTVKINGSSIDLQKGETLHTENSYKYSLESFTSLCNAAGFTLQKSWLDQDKLFSVHYLTVTRN